MALKEEVYEACKKEIKERMLFFHKILNDLTEGAQNDAKGSAGDKHETSLSMMQLEQEKIKKQVKEIQEMAAQLEKINPQLNSVKVSLGSLVQTSIGYFYIAVALGKLKLGNTDFYVISQHAPLAKQLLGLSLKQEIMMNSKKIIIQEIY
jgi:hypothetical protein